MATWEDGPEYAPSVRPDAFVTPDAAPLTPPAPPSPAPDAAAPPSEVRPEFTPSAEAVPLDRVAAPAPPQRDPREAFDVEPAPVMASVSPTAPLPIREPGAWGSAHAPQVAPRPQQAWAPEQPFTPPPAPTMQFPAPAPVWPPPQINPTGFPPPTAPGWYPPPQAPTPGGPLRAVDIGQMMTASTPAVLITLGLGGLLAPLSLALFLVASVLATRVHYRRRQVLSVFRTGLLASLILGMVSAYASFQELHLFLLWDHIGGWAQAACWIVGIGTLLIQGDALRRNEPREPQL